MRNDPRGDAGKYAVCAQLIAQPVSIIASVSEHWLGLWGGIQHERRALVVAHLPLLSNMTSGRPLQSQTAWSLGPKVYARRGDGVTVGDEVTTRAYLESGRLTAPFAMRLPSPDAYYVIRPRNDANEESFHSWLKSEADEHRRWFSGFWQ